MNKQNLLSITLIVTGLALNPAMGEIVETRVMHHVPIAHSVTSDVASFLVERGLDEEAAEKMAKSVVGENELLLAVLIHNLEIQSIITKDEVLNYLGKAALHKQIPNFKSYDQLLGMVSSIQKKPLEESTRNTLSQIVKINKALFV